LDDGDTWIDWNLIWESPGMSGLKEGAVRVVGEQSLQERKKKRATRRRHQQKPQKRRNGDTLMGYLEQRALTREQCDKYDHLPGNSSVNTA
jgi:hypothetical protein